MIQARKPIPERVRRTAVAALLLCAPGLWSCGGAGSPTDAGSSLSSAEVESQLFQLANVARREAELQPELLLDGLLGDIARQHSESMRDEGFFGHVGPQGGGLNQRLDAAGVRFRRAAENIAKVTHSVAPAAVAHDLLMNSGEHRSNILDPGFRRVGVGVARSHHTFWITQIFVAP